MKSTIIANGRENRNQEDIGLSGLTTNHFKTLFMCAERDSLHFSNNQGGLLNQRRSINSMTTCGCCHGRSETGDLSSDRLSLEAPHERWIKQVVET